MINACRAPRRDTFQTWIHDNMVLAYRQLFKIGAAASIEVWAGMPYDSELIGGLYGVSFGSIFCGESMFHRRNDASKNCLLGIDALGKSIRHTAHRLPT